MPRQGEPSNAAGISSLFARDPKTLVMSTARSLELATLLSMLSATLLACSDAGPSSTLPQPPNASATTQDAGIGTGAGSGRPAACQQPPLAAAQVLFVGETFIALTRSIPTFLAEQARQAGAIATDGKYRDGSVSGAELATGALLEQYRRAAAEAPAKLVVMNAGSNDLLFGGRCADGSDARCDELVTAAQALFAEMAEGGVTDVVYFFYPEPKGIGARIKPAMDTLRPQLQSLCETTALVRCHWLDLRPVFEGHPEYTGGDGMYPTYAGSRATANAIWELMGKTCLGA
jgi:hypothetical protein